MRNVKLAMSAASLWALLLLLPGPVGATIMIETGLVGGSGDVENVLLDPDQDDGMMVTGTTQVSDILVNFTSDEVLTIPATGQARIEALDGAFNYLKIEPGDPTLGFAKMQFNIDALFDALVTLTFTDQYGNIFSGDFEVGGAGENFFTATALDDQMIMMAEIESIEPIQAVSDLAQVRIGGAPEQQNPIPEPSTMLLLGCGLLGLARVARSRSRG